MCTLAQTPTTITNTIINNKTMNNNTHSNNKVTVMTSLINVLFNSNNPSYQADNEVDAMSNKIQYTNEYEVDLNNNHPVYSDVTEDAQFEAEIEALYEDDSEMPVMSTASMEAIMAFAAQQAWVKKDVNNNVNSDVNEEDVMKNEENKMFSIVPVLAIASANMTQDRIMIVIALIAMVVAMIAAVVAMFWYENKQKTDKLAKQVRKMAAESEQQRMHDAFYMMERRERNIAYARQQALDQAERIARLEREAAEHEAWCRQEEEREAQRIARNARLSLEIAERQRKNLEMQAELGCKQSAETMKYQDFIKSIENATDINALWTMFDTQLKEEITFESFIKAEKNLQESADYSFFYKNASIQGIRSYWLMLANVDESNRNAAAYNNLAIKFSEFARALEKAMRNSENEYYHFICQTNWQHGYNWQAYRILTKAEWQAAKLLIEKKTIQFFSRWCLPLNDAATGGLLVAMSKDAAFADEMHAMKTEENFWCSKEMNAEKNLWKANQWKTYAQRYNKVKQLKEDLMPIFALEEVAICKLTTDVVVGFKFGSKEFKSCDVADTEQVEKILAAGYDQVLRIRRTDAAGMWNESQQINSKYTGKFCTGHGTQQSHGYYQEKFLNGTNIPWIADIQINGEWDNFGVILTNSAGVVDFGMGDNNRSSKHRPILIGMFGDGESSETKKTPGQIEAMKISNTWFIQREFNINHVVAQIKAKLAADSYNDVW